MKSIFDRLSLMAKVALAPVLVLLCLLIIALYGLWTSKETARTLDVLTQQSLVHVTLVAQAQERAVAANGMLMQSVAYAGAGLKPAVIQALDAKIGLELKAAQQRFDHLREVFANDKEATARLTHLDTAYKKYTKAALDTLDMKDADLSTAAVMMSTAETSYNETRGLLDELFKHEVQDATLSGESATTSLATGNMASMTMAAMALLLGMLVTWLIARQIVQPLQAAVEIARDVADGNLSLRAVQAGRDETGQVLRALGEVAQRLNGMMADIRSGADQIDTAASEISIGNNDLATRTEQTASALQATSSSIAELTQTTRLNAETAIQANQLAADAARIAQQGGSEAAKEIRGLIGASVEQVASGTSKVHAAGETMRRIVSSIEQVSTMVAEISRATAEQANAIHGVNDAVSDMDRNTQQNAALVEESAAAAESLRGQAAGLVQAISVFHVTEQPRLMA